MSATEREEFLCSLPRVSATDRLVFRCGPHIACFNRCCADLDLLLSPYDAMRLRAALELDSDTVLKRHFTVTTLPVNGFPAVRLEMRRDRARSCPFVLDTGCSVYAHRPGACRVYPLGREASIDDRGNLTEEYLLVKESHCEGFDEQIPAIPVADYLASQGISPYLPFDNRYLRLMHRFAERGASLDDDRFEQIFRAVYRPDTLPLPPDARSREDRLAFETARLRTGFEWIEHALFAGAP